MEQNVQKIVSSLILPQPDSHKGQNGRLLLIGGSKLFHAASLWSLTVASRLVDLVHYCSIEENNAIVESLKAEFRNGIIVPREDVDIYIKEDDVILIGPGMTRDEETKILTDRVLQAYPEKQWVIDAGALQMMDSRYIPHGAILTPHHQEFRMLLEADHMVDSIDVTNISRDQLKSLVRSYARNHHCIILVKGMIDVVSNGSEVIEIAGGNAGMTKGGTGDVLAGLIAGLACTNPSWNATIAGSYVNKKAGDDLYESVGPFFNATDLTNQLPQTMKRFIID